MTENGRNVLARAARVLLVCGVLSFGATGLWAQGTSGKVQGIVLDPTGQPIPNSQVFVLGTSFAALTNEDGFYFINNVPAGSYSMRAQFIGYQPAEISGVRVLADQTLTVDFRLSGAVALEAITITAATAPIVPRDQVASKSIVTGEDVENLPVDDALNLVLLAPGVVSARGGAISIRGSRANEAVIFVDGAPVRRMDTGSTPLSVATNMMQEASVTTGAMDAAFGDAQAGVISLVTRSGGPRYVGSVAYETDDFMGTSLATGYNRFEGSVSGPVFGNLTFSLGGSVVGSRNAATRKGEENIATYTFNGVDTTVTEVIAGDSAQTLIPRIVQFSGKCDPAANFGFECQGRVQPYGFRTDTRASGKLQYTYGSGSRVALSALTNINQGLGPTTMNFESANGDRTTSNVFVLNWVQQVFRGADNELAFDLNLSYQTDRVIAGIVDRTQELGLRDPTMGIVFGPLDFVNSFERWAPGDPATHLTRDATGGYLITQLKTNEDWDALIENVRYGRGTLRPYLNRTEIENRTIPRLNAYGVTGGFNNVAAGVFGTWLNERRYVGRATVDWQADRYNRFKFGGEGTIARLNRFSGTAIIRTSFGSFYTAEPYKFGLFAQDRVDLGDLVIEVGLRYDKYDTRTIFPLVPSRTFNNPAFDAALSVEEMTCASTKPEECDVNADVWYTAPSHSSLAPRVRVSFPVTDRTGFRLSYAHQTQVPEFNQMYQGTNNDLANTNSNERWGGDADFGRTILFEFGIRHAFSPDMVLDVAAYNKDKTSDITYRILNVYDTFDQRDASLNLLTNADFGNVRGIDIQLIRRFGNIFAGQVSYTAQNAQSTGSDPQDYLQGLSRIGFNVAGERPPPPQYTLRTRDDRRHNIQGSFTATLPADFAEGAVWGKILSNVGIFGTFQARSGLPYTLLKNNADGQRSTGDFGLGATIAEPLQSSETPWEKFFDLRVTKGFRLGPTDWTVYADVRNVFNFTNISGVFQETGDVINEQYAEETYVLPQQLRMENDAVASGAWTTITKTAADGSSRIVGAIDLRDVGATCPNWVGGGGPVACVMLQRTEQRFGDGDGYYDVDEQTLALTEWYNYAEGPETFYGTGRLVRVGLQLTF